MHHIDRFVREFYLDHPTDHMSEVFDRRTGRDYLTTFSHPSSVTGHPDPMIYLIALRFGGHQKHRIGVERRSAVPSEFNS